MRVQTTKNGNFIASFSGLAQLPVACSEAGRGLGTRVRKPHIVYCSRLNNFTKNPSVMVHIPGKTVYRCGLTRHITVQLAEVGDYKLQLAIVHTAIIVVTKHVGGPPRPPASEFDRIMVRDRSSNASYHAGLMYSDGFVQCK